MYVRLYKIEMYNKYVFPLFKLSRLIGLLLAAVLIMYYKLTNITIVIIISKLRLYCVLMRENSLIYRLLIKRVLLTCNCFIAHSEPSC